MKKGITAHSREKGESEEIKQLKNQLARALADYDNLRKRVESTKQDLVYSASLRIISQLLPVLDQLEQANAHLKDQGLAISLQNFREVLKLEGYEEIKIKVGDKFDENIHEVIEVIDGEQNNTVADVLQSGWKNINGLVIRPAKVKVFKKNKNIWQKQ